MGEYAKHNGQSIKIGTCEDMYYLRAEQRHEVAPEPIAGDRYWPGLRFRFPWPDEDGTEPGGERFHERYDRSVHIPGATVPEGVGHGKVQFTASPGYLVSLPCPEGPEAQPFHIHRNGFKGRVHLVRQKLMEDGRLVPVLKCGGCGYMWRLEDRHDIEELAVLCRSEADRREGHSDWWHKIADRILEGAKIFAEATE